MKQKRFKVISLHPYTSCQMNCPNCYKTRTDRSMEKPEQFWYDLIPYIKKFSNQIACIEENELVLVKKNNFIFSKKIGDVLIGDNILSKQGFGEVVNVSKKSVNEIIEMNINGGKKLLLTKDHILPIKRFSSDRVGRRKEIEPIEKRTDEIIPGEYLFSGDIFNNYMGNKVDLFDASFKTELGSYLKYDNKQIWIERSKIKIPRYIIIDAKFARLVGYYISEGYDRGFSFNVKEKRRIEDCKKCFKSVFGIDLTATTNDRNSTSLECRSRFVIPLLRHRFCLGKHAKNKSLGYMLSLNEDLLQELLCGIFGGDGHWRLSKDKRSTDAREYYSCNYEVSSVSKKLIDELVFLFENRMGIKVSIYRSKGKPRKIEGRDIIRYDSDIFRLYTFGLENIKKMIKIFRFNEDYEEKLTKFNKIFTNRRYENTPTKNKELRIISLKTIKGTFNVVDLTMKDEPYFVCGNNILVHNCGGGEPFMNPEFIKNLASASAKAGILFNVTSNGRLLMKMKDKELKDILRDVSLISLSFDDYKVATKKDLNNYLNLVKRIKGITGCQIGANLLISQRMFERGGKPLIDIVNLLFRTGVDRVFALYPKNMPYAPDVLKFRLIYTFLTAKYKNFYLDDCSKMILTEKAYKGWKNPCHYGKDLISINELGIINGCSFDSNQQSLLTLNQPKDLLKLNKVKIKERFDCPYIMRR